MAPKYAAPILAHAPWSLSSPSPGNIFFGKCHVSQGDRLAIRSHVVLSGGAGLGATAAPRGSRGRRSPADARGR